MYRKNLLRVWAVLCLCVLLVAAACSALAEERQKIRVGYFHFPGYHEISADGRYSGYGYDVLQMLRFYNNWDYEYVGYNKSWDEMVEMLDRGEIDLLTSARWTEERAERFAFSSMPIGIKATRLSVREDDKRFTPENYSTYNGIRVATLNGSSQNEVFVEFAAQHGFSYTLVPFASTDELEKALLYDRTIDAVLTSNVRYMKNERVLNQFADRPFYIMTQKNNIKLIEQVDAALYQINEAEPLWFNNLWYKHYRYAPDEPNGKLAEQAEAFHQSNELARKEYAVLVNVGHAPYAYLDAGEIKGVLPDIFREIAHRAQISYKLLPVHNLSEYQSYIEAGKADFILDMPQDDYYAEQSGYLLSSPYVSTTLFCVQRNHHANVTNRLAVVRNKKDSPVVKRLSADYSGVVYFDTYDECIEAVKNSTCDATYLDVLQAQEAVSGDVRRELVMTLEPDSNNAFCIGISDKLPAQLRSLINQAVISTNADYNKQIIGQYLLRNERHTSLKTFIYDNPLQAMLVLAVIGACGAFVVIMYIRQKNMRIIRAQNEKLREKQQQLTEALAKAELANKAKTNFLNNMSHDIRTPMNSIIGFTEVALDELGGNLRVRDYLEKIHLSGQHLLSLINDILEMSRIDSGKLELKPAPCDIAELLQGLKVMLQITAEEKKLHFVLDIDKLKDKYVLCDKLLLQRCLLNCLSNALKYTLSGGTVILQAVQSEAEAGKAHYTIRICDNGIGMSKEFLKHVYDVFERENSSTVNGIGGTGLGMAITKNILTLMGGTIEIKSEKNLGTEVIINLTLPLSEKSPEEALLAENVKVDMAIFKGKKMLLVDDVKLNREIAAIILQRAGMEVTMLADGKEAVDYMCSTKGDKVDAILMDLMMPGMDGFEATRLIRTMTDKKKAGVPIIALTASAFEENKQQAIAAGMNGHIAKPISVESMAAELAKYFAKAKE